MNWAVLHKKKTPKNPQEVLCIPSEKLILYWYTL